MMNKSLGKDWVWSNKKYLIRKIFLCQLLCYIANIWRIIIINYDLLYEIVIVETLLSFNKNDESAEQSKRKSKKK